MRVHKKNAEKALQKYAELKQLKENVEKEMKEIMDGVFRLSNPPEEVTTTFGILKLSSRTNREAVMNGAIHQCLKQLKYSEDQISKLYKFQTGKLKEEVGKSKFQQWIDKGYIEESVSQFYKLTKTPKNQE